MKKQLYDGKFWIRCNSIGCYIAKYKDQVYAIACNEDLTMDTSSLCEVENYLDMLSLLNTKDLKKLILL